MLYCTRPFSFGSSSIHGAGVWMAAGWLGCWKRGQRRVSMERNEMNMRCLSIHSLMTLLNLVSHTQHRTKTLFLSFYLPLFLPFLSLALPLSFLPSVFFLVLPSTVTIPTLSFVSDNVWRTAGTSFYGNQHLL